MTLAQKIGTGSGLLLIGATHLANTGLAAYKGCMNAQGLDCDVTGAHLLLGGGVNMLGTGIGIAILENINPHMHSQKPKEAFVSGVINGGWLSVVEWGVGYVAGWLGGKIFY